MFERSDFRHCLKSKHAESEHFVCVPKIPNVRNPNVLKSELAFVWIWALYEIRMLGFLTFTVQ